jgi:hypothetical protein
MAHSPFLSQKQISKTYLERANVAALGLEPLTTEDVAAIEPYVVQGTG